MVDLQPLVDMVVVVDLVAHLLQLATDLHQDNMVVVATVVAVGPMAIHLLVVAKAGGKTSLKNASRPYFEFSFRFRYCLDLGQRRLTDINGLFTPH